MQEIEVAVIGTGWCGGLRAETLARHPLVKALHIAEVVPERLAEVARATGAASASADWNTVARNPATAAVYISATPETLHHPMAKACLAAGKHVFLEKPIALELAEA